MTDNEAVTNTLLDPAVTIVEDDVGLPCPHCDWRFLTAHGRTNHVEHHHPAAEVAGGVSEAEL